MKFGQAASEEMSFECVYHADEDDGRRTNGYPISSPEAFGFGELKMSIGHKIVWLIEDYSKNTSIFFS